MSTIKRPLLWQEYPEFVDYVAPNIVDATNPPLVISTNIGAETDLLGKKISELQSGVLVKPTSIVGTLKYQESYDGFEEGASGNFIALHAFAPGATTITVQVVGSQIAAKELDKDGLAVVKIASTTQSIKFTATDGTNTTEKVFTLTDIVLEEAPEEVPEEEPEEEET